MSRRSRTPRGAQAATAESAKRRGELDALLHAGRWSEARVRAEQWIEETPEDAHAHALLARALFYLGEPAGALAAAERSVALEEGDPLLLARLGGLYAAVGRLDDAILRCRQAIALDPAEPHAIANLAHALLRTGKNDQAFEVLSALSERAALPPAARQAALGVLDELGDGPKLAALRSSIDRARAEDAGISPAVLSQIGRVRARSEGVLAKVGRDVTALARGGRLAPVAGRDAEIDAVIDVLCKRRKSNPCLVGPAGVGKTAIIEGLARRIADGAVPSSLRGARIIEVSASSLTAGTTLRGELEERLHALLAEVRDDRGAILFLDEVHTLVGSGPQGGSEIAEVLKPAMARGELSLLGATTEEGFERAILRDPALARRFERIDVAEPDASLLRVILRAAAEDLAQHHGVSILEVDLETTERLAQRWLADRRMPDVGVDVLDRACVRAARAGLRALDERVLRETVAAIARCALAHLEASPAATLETIEASLSRAVRGQPRAVSAIAEQLAFSALRGAEGTGPRATLWLIGPRSVGKHTALAALAAATDRPLIRFDLGALTDRADLPRLFGASAGYVGYDDGAPLLRALRSNPSALLCLDAPELAHPDAREALARALRLGAFIDARGDRADLRRAIVVFVSALQPTERARVGFEHGSASPSDLRGLEGIVGPALWGALDATIPFDALSEQSLTALADGVLAHGRTRLERGGVQLSIDPDVSRWLARGVRRASDLPTRCEQLIVGPTLRRCVDGPRRWSLSVDDGALRWTAIAP
jgi:ATP-dependent Clp protease ATP-binding subunit ClpA